MDRERRNQLFHSGFLVWDMPGIACSTCIFIVLTADGDIVGVLFEDEMGTLGSYYGCMPSLRTKSIKKEDL